MLIILALLVGAFFFYRYLFVSGQPSDTPGLQAANGVEPGPAGQSSVADDEFIRLLERLQGVKLDSTLFASPAWKGLTNFHIDLVRESKGRRNPFSPIGFDPLASTTMASSSSSRRP